MKDECEGLMQQTEDFRKMTDQFIALTEQVRFEFSTLTCYAYNRHLKSTNTFRRKTLLKWTWGFQVSVVCTIC